MKNANANRSSCDFILKRSCHSVFRSAAQECIFMRRILYSPLICAVTSDARVRIWLLSLSYNSGRKKIGQEKGREETLIVIHCLDDIRAKWILIKFQHLINIICARVCVFAISTDLLARVCVSTIINECVCVHFRHPYVFIVHFICGNWVTIIRFNTTTI